MLGKKKNTDESLVILDLPTKTREYYNTLRDRLMLSFNATQEPPRSIAVTSCYRREGVTTVAINLSVTLSHHGTVLLVDANLNRPYVHKAFKKKLSYDFTDVLEEDKPVLAQAAFNLYILTAEHLSGNRSITYESPQKLSKLLDEYKRDYDFVVFDTPPVNEVSASLRIASLVDGVILVVEAERTRHETVRRTKEQLEHVKARMLGAVLNKRRFPIPRLFYRK